MPTGREHSAPNGKKDGSVRRPARITAFLNGVLVQDNVTLTGPTSWLQQKPYEKHADTMSLKLQDHDSPVRFRNIWVRPLPQRDHLKKIKMKTREAKVQLSTDQLDRFVGAYETIDPTDEKKEVPFIVIRREGDQLLAAIRDKQEWPVIPQSETEFVFETFDGTLTFVQDEKGVVTGVNFRVGLEPDFEKKL